MQKDTWNRETPKDKKRGRDKPSKRDDCCDAGRADRAEVVWTLHGLPFSATMSHDDMPVAFFSRYLGIARLLGDHEQQQLFQSRPVSHSVGVRVERCLEGMGRLLSDSPHLRRTTNAPHTMQDHLQQTMVMSQRRSQKTLTEQAAPKTKGNAACETTEGTRSPRRGAACLRSKMPGRRRSRDDLQRRHQEQSGKTRCTRETRQRP